MTMEVDSDRNMLVSYDEREVPYDLLVTVPVNMGADFVERSGLGDELNHVEVDKHTFLADDHDNIFAIGDAANLPDIEGRFGGALRGRRVRRQLHGAHRRTADDRALRRTRQLLHRVGQRQGPAARLQLRRRAAARQVPGAGRRPLLPAQGDRANHMGKLGFRWIYWNMLLPGRPIPMKADMSMAGKELEDAAT